LLLLGAVQICCWEFFFFARWELSHCSKGAISSFQAKKESQMAPGAILSIHVQKHTKIIK
jgi:fatty acid desaturase